MNKAYVYWIEYVKTTIFAGRNANSLGAHTGVRAVFQISSLLTTSESVSEIKWREWESTQLPTEASLRKLLFSRQSGTSVISWRAWIHSITARPECVVLETSVQTSKRVLFTNASCNGSEKCLMSHWRVKRANIGGRLCVYCKTL